MTITSESSRMDYVGNGSTDTYAYTFKIFVDADLLVTVRDTDESESTLVLDSDYTVTGAGDPDGGEITLTDGNLTTDYVLTIRRVRDVTQETDIRNQGEFFPEVHEDAFDHLIMVDQQQEDEIGRSLKLPETVSPDDFDPALPSELFEAVNYTFMTNDNGDGFELGPSASEISNAATYASAAAASAAAAAAYPALNQPYGINNITITTSVGANALTIAAKQSDGTTDHGAAAAATGTIVFRSATITSGAFNSRSITGALSLTVPSTATLGHNDGAVEYIYVYMIDNSGTVELAVSSSNHRSEQDVITTTVLNTSSDDAATIYSTSARVGVPFRLVGILKITEATAGTWASNATVVTPRDLFFTDFVVTKAAAFNAKHGFKYSVSTAAARNVQLPAPSANFRFRIHDSTGQSETNAITLVRNGSESINGTAANKTLQGNFFDWEVYSDGTNYFVTGMDVGNAAITAPDGHVIVDTGNGHGGTNTKIRRFTNTRLNQGSSITYADSAGNGGSFTINEDGVYAVTYCEENDAGVTQIGISVNGSALTTDINSITYAQGKRAVVEIGSGSFGTVSWTGRLAASDIVRAHTDGAPGASTDNTIFSICQVSQL